MRTSRGSPVRACERCRRQKLKCDAQKPCTLCTRAGVACVATELDIWRSSRREQKQTRRNRRADPTSVSSSGSRQSSGLPPVVTADDVTDVDDLEIPYRATLEDTSPSEANNSTPAFKSSSTIGLIEEAFRYHDTAGPQNLSTSALRTDQREYNRASELEASARPVRVPSHPMVGGWQSLTSSKSSRSAVTELVALLPAVEPARVLMNTYFDRIHWFMLLFHQDEFRISFEKLVVDAAEGSSNISLDCLATALAVCAISLQYVGPHRRSILAGYGIDPPTLKKQLLDALGRTFLDILALGSMETVQACVLLGTYYLYHGQPDLAWPICGCGLRIAQAIGLHRQAEMNSVLWSGLLQSYRRSNEARKRCWWAIYEIETFCSMLYGLPLSISESDCDVEYLDPFVQPPQETTRRAPGAPQSNPGSLLFYKPMMSKLSVIVKSALTDLYRIRPDFVLAKARSISQSTRLRHLVQKVQDLDGRLRAWYDGLPPELRVPSFDEGNYVGYSDEELEKDVGASGPKFEMLILRLQALALKLAYENAKILIHRPLLTYRMVARLESSRSASPSSQRLDPCQFSIKVCREAALETSRLGSPSIFRHACSTYAVAFVGTHLLTAGITLCILAGLEPLSQESHDSKVGVRRLMHMQSHIKPRSVLADQGLDILKKLVALSMQKELRVLLASPQTTILPEGPFEADQFPRGTEAASAGQNVARPGQTSESHELAEVEIMPAEDFSNSERYDFCENGNLMQTILDFDQAMQPPDDLPRPGSVGTSNLAQSDQYFEHSFMDQEQGWIWAHDFS